MSKIKVALIGCGGRNSVHFIKLKEFDDTEFVGFCDVAIEKAERMASESGQGKAYSCYKDMLSEITPDVVYIAVPPDQHGDIEFAVIDKGCHFMVEKPMALDIGLAESICEAAKSKNLITCVGFQDRYQNLTIDMKNYLKNEKVGLVTAAWMGGIPGVMWWRKMSTSGGQIVEQNIHLYDQLRYLFGEPESVYCSSGKSIVDPEEYGVPGYDVDDYSSAVAKFPNGIVANIFTSCYHKEGSTTDSGMTVYCKNSTLHYKLRTSLTIHDKEGLHEPILRGEEQTGIMDRTFIDAIKSGNTSNILSDYSDALKSLRFTLAANESALTGKPVIL